MKRKTTLSMLVFCLTYTVVAQCTSVIPANVIIISGASQEFLSGNEDYWVCASAANKTFTGGLNNIWIEEGATQITVESGNSVVYYNGSTPFGHNIGGFNTIYVENPSVVNDIGAQTSITECGAGNVIFSYANVDMSNCSTVGIKDEVMLEVTVSPNPVMGNLLINAGSKYIKEVHICDLGGREITIPTNNDLTDIQVGELVPGLYLLRIVTDQGTAISRFMKI